MDAITGRSFRNVPAGVIDAGDRIRLTFDGATRTVVSVRPAKRAGHVAVKFTDSTPGKSTVIPEGRNVFLD